MIYRKGIKWIAMSALLIVSVYFSVVLIGVMSQKVSAAQPPTDNGVEANAAGDYIVLAWNDLGMHCYNPSYADLAMLPPYNTLWAQVIRVGDPPQIVTTGITVTYVFTDNTYSVGKTDFWDYEQEFFGINLPNNVGLTGKGLSGTMDLHDSYFVAEGIPLTEYRDSAPTTLYPYQLATVIVSDTTTSAELARTITVAPVSSEIRCDNCHYDNGPGNSGIATGVMEQNILTKHDQENMGQYPPGHPGPLMGRRPILCAECHASNALGAPGVAGIPNFSNAVHSRMAAVVPNNLTGCYMCHPGPQTRCLRCVMSQRGMTCINCHGGMQNVAQNPNPWLNEPRCDNGACHGSLYRLDQPLYRMSKEHGGIYCSACHDSPHAIAPSREANDGIKFIALQGHAGTLDTCTVCHSSMPTGPGPHSGINIYLPIIMREYQ